MSKGRDEVLIGRQWALRRLIQYGLHNNTVRGGQSCSVVSWLNKEYVACSGIHDLLAVEVREVIIPRTMLAPGGNVT